MARLVVDEVVTKYSMDPDGYVRGVTTVKHANQDLIKSHNTAFGKGGLAGIKDHFSGILSAAGGLVSAVSGIAGAILALAAAIASAGAYAFKEFASFDSLTRSLVAVEGSAEKAKISLQDLKNIAKSPGVDFEEAVRGYGGLRRQGLGSDFSKRLVMEAGNANAYGGGDKATFAQIMRALTQIAAKDFLQGDELLQLQEAGIGAQKMIRNKFGTSDTEELKKRGIGSQQVLAGLVEELGKLERVGDGPQNQIDNFFSALHFGVIGVGLGLAEFTSSLTSLTSIIEKFTDAGVFKRLGQEFAALLSLDFGQNAIVNATAGIMTFMDVLGMLKDFAVGMYNEIASFINNSWIGKLLKSGGFGAIAPIASASGFDPGKLFEGNKAVIEGMLKVQSKKAANSSFDPRLVPLIADAKGGNPALPVLRQIAENTDPLKGIMDKVLGGGSLSPSALNRQDMSDLRTGRGSGAGVEGLAKQFARDLVYEIMRMPESRRREI